MCMATLDRSIFTVSMTFSTAIPVMHGEVDASTFQNSIMPTDFRRLFCYCMLVRIRNGLSIGSE